VSSRKLFKPDDPMDAMSEMFRREVIDIALRADKISIYRDMNEHEQIEVFLCGALTGVVSVALASIKKEHSDVMMEYIANCLPLARQMAESITGYAVSLPSTGESNG